MFFALPGDPISLLAPLVPAFVELLWMTLLSRPYMESRMTSYFQKAA
jgi:hypothetical protein